MTRALRWFVPKALANDAFRCRSKLAADDLRQRICAELNPAADGTPGKRLIGQYERGALKAWLSSHLNEVNDGQGLMPSVVLRGRIISVNPGSEFDGMVQPHWSTWLVVGCLGLLVGFGFLRADSAYIVGASGLTCLFLILIIRQLAKQKRELKHAFLERFDLLEV